MKVRKLLMCMLLVVFAITCSGCGKLTAEEIIEKFAESSASVDNCEATMKMNMTMESAGESFSITMDSTMQMVMNPDIEAKVAMNMDMGEMGAYDMETYIVKEEDAYYTYVKASDMWMKQEIPSEELESQLSTYKDQVDYSVYTDNMQNFKLEGEELVGEKETYKISGVITGESLKAVMEKSGVSDYAVADTEGIDYSQLGDLKITLWVEKKTFVPVKIYMDMADMMANMLASSEETAEIKMPVCDMEVEYVSFDVKEIVLPEEAKNATNMEDTVE